MNPQKKFSAAYTLGLYLIALLSLTLAGCGSIGTRTVGTDNRIALMDSDLQTRSYWENNVELQYGYRLDGDYLNLHGDVRPGRRIEFTRIQLLLLDKKGAILKSKNIYYSQYRSSTRFQNKDDFELSLKIPSNTRSISFDIYAEHRIRR